jgi:acyl transferase domain-containing protein
VNGVNEASLLAFQKNLFKRGAQLDLRIHFQGAQRNENKSLLKPKIKRTDYQINDNQTKGYEHG